MRMGFEGSRPRGMLEMEGDREAAMRTGKLVRAALTGEMVERDRRAEWKFDGE